MGAWGRARTRTRTIIWPSPLDLAVDLAYVMILPGLIERKRITYLVTSIRDSRQIMSPSKREEKERSESLPLEGYMARNLVVRAMLLVR